MVLGLVAMHRYRLVTAIQVARIAGLNPAYAREQLRTLERHKLLGSIGNVGLRGGSKTPKLYFLNRTGYRELLDASGLDEAALGPYVKPHTSTKWSPTMAHRVGTIDLLVAAEAALAGHPTYQLVATLHEYRRVTVGRTQMPETSDLIADDTADRIVPDGVLIVRNQMTGGSGLFFVECDRGTERITTAQEAAYSLTEKFKKYERYLLGGRFAQTYARFGTFSYATILFATSTPARIANIRTAAAQLNPQLHKYFWLSTMEDTTDQFFAGHWRSRDPHSSTIKALLKEG